MTVPKVHLLPITSTNPLVLEKRLSVYENETLPMLPIYSSRNLLTSITCSDNPSDVTSQLISSLAKLEDYETSRLPSYTWLTKQPTPHSLDTLTQFRDKALVENLFNKTGVMRRFIYLETTNMSKFYEHTKIFTGLYGIEVLRLPVGIDKALLLSIKTSGLVPLAVIREESNLYRPNSEEFSSLEHGKRAVNRSKLVAHMLKEGKLVEQVYVYNTEGTIDLTRRSSFNASSVFGWDDIFVLDSGLSYHQLSQYGVKRSSRDMVISDFLRDNVYYKTLMDVEFNKQLPTRVIDFSVSVSDFVKQNKYYNNELAVSYGYRNLQNHVLNFGVFFRGAKNRRQNNYWNPGKNRKRKTKELTINRA